MALSSALSAVRLGGSGCASSGVSVIQPRAGEARQQPCFAGYHVLNGNGDATGLEWIREAGLLTTAIATTNTHSVGVVRDAVDEGHRLHEVREGEGALDALADARPFR